MNFVRPLPGEEPWFAHAPAVALNNTTGTAEEDWTITSVSSDKAIQDAKEAPAASAARQMSLFALVFKEGYYATSTVYTVKSTVEYDHSRRNTEYAPFAYKG